MAAAGSPKTMHMCGLWKDHCASSSQFRLSLLCSGRINVQIELRANSCLHFVLQLQYIPKPNQDRLVKIKCVFFALFLCQQVAASCSVAELAGRFQHRAVRDEKTHNNQNAVEMFRSRTALVHRVMGHTASELVVRLYKARHRQTMHALV